MMVPLESSDKFDTALNRLEYLVERFESGSKESSSVKKYRAALRDAVDTLEATKQAFKSKQLKALRERIEAVLDES